MGSVKPNQQSVDRWRETRVREDYERVPPRKEEFTTLSGAPIKDLRIAIPSPPDQRTRGSLVSMILMAA